MKYALMSLKLNSFQIWLRTKFGLCSLGLFGATAQNRGESRCFHHCAKVEVSKTGHGTACGAYFHDIILELFNEIIFKLQSQYKFIYRAIADYVDLYRNKDDEYAYSVPVNAVNGNATTSSRSSSSKSGTLK